MPNNEGSQPTSADQTVEFTNGALSLTIDRATGRWSGIVFAGEPIMEPGGGTALAITLHETGEAVTDFWLAGHSINEGPRGMEVTLSLSCAAIVAAGIQVSETLLLNGESGTIERRVTTSGINEYGTAIRSATLVIDGLTAGDPNVAKVSVPMTRFLPGTPLRRAARRLRLFDNLEKADENGDFDFVLSAQDLIVGAVTVGRETPPLTVTITPTQFQFAATLRLYGADERLVIEHEFAAEARVAVGETLVVGEQVIQIQARRWADAVSGVGRLLAARNLAAPTDRAAWARDAVIYEADPVFHGTIGALTSKLGEIESAGFNTVYLMPWHLGSYGTVDYSTMAPELGSLSDLRTLTDTAHGLGMRVLFDLLLVIATAKSPYLDEHSDWFYRGADGKPLPHPVWKSPCLDPASPGFRRFLTDYAIRCVDEYGADGFRVDAPAHRGGNWLSTGHSLQPYEHSYAVFTLLDEIRMAMRNVRPDAILMSEIFGPLLAHRCDLVCWQWVFFVDWLIGGLQSGAIDGAALQRVLGEQILVMPPGTWLTYFTVNHDSKAFVGRLPDGDAELALFTTLSLLGAGMLDFGGGWGVDERPGARAAHYAALFAAKSAIGGVDTGRVHFPTSRDRGLFIVERQVNSGRWVRLVTNIGPDTRSLPKYWRTDAVLYSRLGSAGTSIVGWDTLLLEI